MKLSDLSKDQLIAKLRRTRKSHRKVMKDLERIHRAREARIAELEATPSPEERLVAVYKELLELLDAEETGSFLATVSLAADQLAPVVAPILATKAA